MARPQSIRVLPTICSVNFAHRNARGLTLVATDTEWISGDGPEVIGPAEALRMAVNERGNEAHVPALSEPLPSQQFVAALVPQGTIARLPHRRRRSRARPAVPCPS